MIITIFMQRPVIMIINIILLIWFSDLLWINILKCAIWGCCSSCAEVSGLLGCYSSLFVEWSSMFAKNVIPSFSWVKQSKKSFNTESHLTGLTSSNAEHYWHDLMNWTVCIYLHTKMQWPVATYWHSKMEWPVASYILT